MSEITANYDESWKEIIGDYFESFLIFFYPDIHRQINVTTYLKFENKLTQYEEERKMPLLTNIERRAIARTAKETYQENILDLLQVRFNSVPKSIEDLLNNIDDLALLKQLHLSTISVKSLEEFEQLINSLS